VGGQTSNGRWCLSSSSVGVCNAAGGRPPGASAVGRPTLFGGPVRLRPVRATPCLNLNGANKTWTLLLLNLDL